MKRADIDLIQRWLYYDQLSEQDVHARIISYNYRIDIPAAIEIAKLNRFLA